MAKRITEFTGATSLAEGDLFALVDISDTTQATSGTTKKSALSLIADYIKARVETITNKTLSTGSIVDANVNVVEILKKAYPVGSIYINASVSTNPATLLGFGTWSAFGAGRTLVGIDSGDTDFDTVEETGGAKTHTLQTTEMPSHKHTESMRVSATGLGDSAIAVSNATGTLDNTGYFIGNTGGGLAHNNLQPYIVTYLWKRLT
ncbi:MAG TPA: hypothetical protein PK443_05185 [bacterium]|nr:hypothetical protein [bacterium]